MRAAFRSLAIALASFAAVALLPTAGRAADLESLKLVEIPEVCENVGSFETYYEASFKFLYTGGEIVISDKPNGTGRTTVQGGFDMTVQHPDGTSTYFGASYPTSPPMPRPSDISSAFKPGLNTIVFQMRTSINGGCASATALWLVNRR